MITIVLNDEERKIDGAVTVDRLLDLFSLPRRRVAIELNKEVVRKQDWPETKINDADRIEVIHFVGGG